MSEDITGPESQPEVQAEVQAEVRAEVRAEGASDPADAQPADTPADTPAETPARTRTGKSHMRRHGWRVGFWMVFWLSLAVGFLWLAGLSYSGKVVRLPDWASTRIETQINKGMNTGSVSVSKVEFGVSPTGFPRLSLVDITLRDDTGLQIAQVHEVQGAASPWLLLQGEFSPARLYLSGAQVTLRRRANGEFDLAFGQGGLASGNLASVLDGIDQLFIDGPLSQTQEIEANELTITLEDARTGRLWQVTDGQLKLTQNEKIVDITVSFDVFNQTEELAEVVLGFRTDKASSQASFGATFQNAVAADVAAQSPLMSFLSVIDAPISGALRSSINAEGEISELAGTLALGKGALSPTPGAKPVNFEQAKIYIDYAPEANRIDFSNFAVTSELGEIQGGGHIYLRDFTNGWPGTLLGQVQVDKALINAADLFANPVELSRGAVDFRLHLNPFTLEIGQAVVNHQGTDFTLSGDISASRDGWSLALDAHAANIGKTQALALWPLTLAPKPRVWVEQSVTAGELVTLNAGFRLEAGQEPRISVGAGFRGLEARVVKAMAPVTGGSGYFNIHDQSFLVAVEGGQVAATSGAAVDIGGTVFRVANMQVKPTPASVDLHVEGAVGAVLSILDAKPFFVFKNIAYGPDIATGNMVADGRIALVMKPEMKPEEIVFEVQAIASNVRSDKVVPGRVVTAERLAITASNTRLEITGRANLGQASGTGTWFAAIGPAASGASKLEANVVLNQKFLDEFNIGLPNGTLSGDGIGQVSLDFGRGQAPRFEMVSDLNRLRISIADLGWSKPRNRTGRLFVSGKLGARASVDRLEFEAPGLRATGSISIRASGGLDQAVFSRVRLGGWLDAPVTFTGRGPTRSALITISGGTADMRRASFTGGSGSNGQDAPINLNLDRLTITEGIALTSFRGDLNRRNGLRGTFTARVNGGPAIRGVVAPQRNGSAIRITSSNAGGVLKAAEVFQTARGGDMILVLAPLAAAGTYDGDLTITKVRMVGANALAEIMSAVSIVGLLEQLSQEGIAFSEVEARFRLTPTKVIISKASAIGASLGISLDGTYTLGSGTMDMAGVFSPVFLLNGFGQIFTRKGEGLLGFTYTMTGTAADPKIGVNPLSIFTPAMFREIFRKPPPKLSE